MSSLVCRFFNIPRYWAITMNLTKLTKNLASKTSTIQKPHSVSFSLIGFKTEITVWFLNSGCFRGLFTMD
ncbi:Uncharacterised protein [Chlamydia trachomatis]|nr:Uncharacterised protein [Chlamydia trachomatis]